jgi:hypothetical protein
MRFKLHYDKLLSSFAFKFNLRRYTVVGQLCWRVRRHRQDHALQHRRMKLNQSRRWDGGDGVNGIRHVLHLFQHTSAFMLYYSAADELYHALNFLFYAHYQ